MVTRARAFESYHAKTIFIKATCYHYIPSSPNPYIIRNAFQRQSQLSALFISWQSFCCALEEAIAGFLCKEQGSHSSAMPRRRWGTSLSHQLAQRVRGHREGAWRREREIGWGKEVGVWKGMGTKKIIRESITQVWTNPSPGHRKLQGCWLRCLKACWSLGVVLLHQLQKEPVLCCLDALCKNLYSSYNLFWFKIILLWQFENV